MVNGKVIDLDVLRERYHVCSVERDPTKVGRQERDDRYRAHLLGVSYDEYLEAQENVEEVKDTRTLEEKRSWLEKTYGRLNLKHASMPLASLVVGEDFPSSALFSYLVEPIRVKTKALGLGIGKLNISVLEELLSSQDSEVRSLVSEGELYLPFDHKNVPPSLREHEQVLRQRGIIREVYGLPFISLSDMLAYRKWPKHQKFKDQFPSERKIPIRDGTLFVEVLLRAMTDVTIYLHKRKGEEEALDALGWFMSPEYGSLKDGVTFVKCCEILGYNSWELRKSVFRKLHLRIEDDEVHIPKERIKIKLPPNGYIGKRTLSWVDSEEELNDDELEEEKYGEELILF
jgi:hypothetical protein